MLVCHPSEDDPTWRREFLESLVEVAKAETEAEREVEEGDVEMDEEVEGVLVGLGSATEEELGGVLVEKIEEVFAEALEGKWSEQRRAVGLELKFSVYWR